MLLCVFQLACGSLVTSVLERWWIHLRSLIYWAVTAGFFYDIVYSKIKTLNGYIMPLKRLSLSNIAVCRVIFLHLSRWVFRSTGKSMKTSLYADHLFWVLIMFPGKSLRDSGMPFYWQHDPNTAIIAQVWNRREERGSERRWKRNNIQ